jgi:hypothetical protein
MVAQCGKSFGDSRNAHDGAQGEQHKEAVPHGESCTVRPVADARKRCNARAQKRKKYAKSAYAIHASLPESRGAVAVGGGGECMEGVSGKVLLASVRSANAAGVVGLSAKTRAGALAAHLPVTSVGATLTANCSPCASARQVNQSRPIKIPPATPVSMDLDDCK